MSDILTLAEIQARAADGGAAEQFGKGEWCGGEHVGNNGKCQVNYYQGRESKSLF